MASELRTGSAQYFRSSKPGPRSARKADRVRDRVLELRALDRSVEEIAAELTLAGPPVAAESFWTILDAEGIERLARRAPSARGAAPRLAAIKARALSDWPAGMSIGCDHAGLFLLVPAIAELGLSELVASCGYPSTTVLSAWHSLGSLLLRKCARTPRASHAHALADDPGLALLMGLTALPKATHLGSYSYRARRAASEKLLAAVTGRLRELGLATGEDGFNLDFHAIRHHGTDVPLEKHYVPARSQRTRAVLTFFAQDHASQEMVYANAELTKAEQAREVIALADYWQQIAGQDPGLLVFDSKLTTYKVLDELTERGIRWLTLRERGQKLITDLEALPDTEWKKVRIDRVGRYREPEIHDALVKIKRHRQSHAPTRRSQHRPRAPHDADHQRARPHDQATIRALRRTDEHRERARRLHPRLPPQRALLRPAAERRPRHHPHRHRRQPLPPPRPTPHTLRARNPRQALAPLPRHYRHRPRNPRRAHRRAQHPHLPPRPDRRRARRPSDPNPMAQRPRTPPTLPTPIILRTFPRPRIEVS